MEWEGNVSYVVISESSCHQTTRYQQQQKLLNKVYL